jgi:hypothetical protein
VEAVLRLGEMAARPLTLRVKAVEEVLRAATETGKLLERMQIAKVLLSLVPAKVVTRDMLIAAVTRISVLLDDLRMDAPKAASDLADVLATGLAEGTLKPNPTAGLISSTPAITHTREAIAAGGYVPLAHIHKDLAKEIAKQLPGKLDLKALAQAGSKVPKPEGEEEEQPQAGAGAGAGIGAGGASGAGAGAAERGTLSHTDSSASLAREAAADAAAAAVADDEDDFEVVRPGAGKKKKKAKKVVANEEEDE